MRLLFLIIFLLSLKISSSQNTKQISVKIIPLVDSKSLLNIDSTSITNLKFYLTKFSLVKSQNTVWQEENSYHLIDISNPKSLNFAFNLAKKIDFDEIHFLLGTDSLTNVSGAMGGDLDPTKGMYWAWNSGYINFKLEGESKINSFKFHIGGYAPPYQSVQKVELKTINKNELSIALNIVDFLKKIDITKTQNIMSPGKEAQSLSKILSSLFSIK